MAKTSNRTTVFEASPEKLLEIVISPEFQVEQRKLDDAVVDATYHEMTRTEDKLVFELRSKEYERGMTGLNKKKTIEATTKAEWNLKTMVGTWSYNAPSLDRVKISGKQSIEPAGDAARFHAEFTIEVKIPLVGKKAEGMIVDGMNKGKDNYDNLLRQYLAK